MSKIATREAYGKALVKLGQINDNVVVLDADLSKSTKTNDFYKTFPDRFFNMGIAEQNLIGAACGFAAAGKIPFASSFAMFATGRAFEVIRNSACYPKLNVKVCATHAGITVGEDGATHQSVEDIAIMRSIPNMTVMVPADGVEAEQMIFEAAKVYGPMYVRLGRSAVPTIFDENYKFEIGKGTVVREGNDLTIIACGIMVNEAIIASEVLKSEGINARVINMSTIKPIDKELIITAAKETGAIVTAEEHSILGGLGSAVSEVVTEECPVVVKKVGINDTFGESGTPAELVKKYGLTSNDIVKAAKEAIAKK
ncbi:MULTISPECIES: transketolase family protein [Romboutsia]|uniref:Transketolase n=1 Tax=Romboutsia hominis TaxID=1507512 RepID=A0A2P2BMK4_9FIRM|nr:MULTISPECIES: transketolase family protein [Romboutsia]MCH1958698.1 transketolase family protein [Romboutsia hominis]MCH1970614.1 transketolase family protein [Romboutsia hominis]MDB8789932.1 transketolase family protein [Romboutsia sp. 1001216sp1]MDB8794325.1 transketolase family protein [Romboutsia sp. 1001216sp1]MDB8797276.1 transketolase family protein [Romboutsia sp. 1001216sp1]